MNAIAYFEIQSSQPSREIKFYGNVFGWQFTREEFVQIEYYRIDTPGMKGGLLKRPASIPPKESGTNSFVCSVEVTNYDEVAALVIQNGGMVALPKFAIPGRCWQGYFLDADSNTFGIFQVDLNAK